MYPKYKYKRITALLRGCLLAAILYTSFSLVSAVPQMFDLAPEKNRLVILADMGNEPDEEQQMAHMLMYANEFDIEGLIAVTGKYLTKEPRPNLFFDLIDGYARVEDNLRKHASGWPTAGDLQSVVAAGQRKYGIADTGPGLTTPGSRLIEDVLMKEDPRPIYVVVNAGSNTLAQALIELEKKISGEAFAAAIGKLRVYENGSQDNAGAWICSRYPDIKWIRSNYQTYCYGGPSHRAIAATGYKGSVKDMGPYTWEPYPYSPLGQHLWSLEHIQAGHGGLGGRWPMRLFKTSGHLAFVEGGGTVPWLGLVNKGLYDINNPQWGGWSGLFSRERVRNYYSRHEDIKVDELKLDEFWLYKEREDSWTNPENGQEYESNLFTPVWRWRRAFFNDFRCRMDWCVKAYSEANHNPVAAIGDDASNQIIVIDAEAGESLSFDASASSDPDGDDIEYSWYLYPEAGTYSEASTIEVKGAKTAKSSFQLPNDAGGSELHLILEVKDKNAIASLFDYRRVVLRVK